MPRSSYTSPTSALPRSYYSAYSGAQNDQGRKAWLDRNGYPNRSFGVGRGLDNRYGSVGTGISRRSASRSYGSSGKGYGYYGGFNRYGLSGRSYDRNYLNRANAFVNGARLGWKYGKRYGYNNAFSYYDNCYRWPYHLGVSGYRTYGYKGYCYPRYSTSLYLGWGYPWTGYSTGLWSSGYDDYYYDSDTTYITNNYYDDSAYQPNAVGNYGTTNPLTSTSTPGTSIPVQTMSTHQSNGVQAFAQGDFDLARREFVRAILAAPDVPETVMLYGYAHFATGDYLVSALAIRRASEADPTLIERPIDITALYPDRATFEQHLRNLDAYLATNADDVDAQYLAGFVRYAAGDPNGANPYFAKCMSAAPNDVTYFIMRDAALRAAQNMQSAERASRDILNEVELVDMVEMEEVEY